MSQLLLLSEYPTIGRLVLALFVVFSGVTSQLDGGTQSPSPASSYHVHRAVFRCGKMNRGLAWDGLERLP